MHKRYVIKKIIRENQKSRTYIFKGKISYQPGQFIMLWLPGIDEKPFAVSYLEDNLFGITVEEKGRFTKELSKIETGAEVGIRGPFGHGFEIKDSSIVAVGGLGMAPALPLVKKIRNSTIIQGARSKDYLLYLENKDVLNLIHKNHNKIIYCTDDGSFGIKGSITDVLGGILNNKTKSIYTCGPEMMIKKVFEMCEANKVECQASLERYMRCGFGICGACACGDRLVCKDGPVFKSEDLRKMKEFGRSAMLKSGRKATLKEYFSYT
ncbi:dihydroorotate dehydrogenase electron transfer subunit [Candidatus Woesearchaeota archaeon]|nr:dihydroorotate dehydrogenase electron transfer subunit [Candidatus Woesearchaeota archaeon]